MTLYRAVSNFDGLEHQINDYVNRPRKPKDTEPALHKIIDDWFFAEFGVRARSQTIFCTQCRAEAANHLITGGKIIEIRIPNGVPYKVVYSYLVNDLYNETRYLQEPFCKAEVESLLKCMKYKITDDINTIPQSYKGELMLYITDFYAYEV